LKEITLFSLTSNESIAPNLDVLPHFLLQYFPPPFFSWVSLGKKIAPHLKHFLSRSNLAKLRLASRLTVLHVDEHSCSRQFLQKGIENSLRQTVHVFVIRLFSI
jgi:hypothetical protein